MNIKIVSIPLVILSCLLLLSGCISFHPLGMSDSEWNALSPEQKIAAQEKHEKLQLQKKQLKAQQQAATRAETAKRYENAVYGDIITVIISGGTMDIHGKRREYEPIAFDLVRGESKKVAITRKGKQYQKDSAIMRLSKDGRTLYFDDKQRNKLTLVDDGWDYGMTYRVQELKNRNTNPRNVNIKIRYRSLSGRRDQVIIVR